MADLVVGMFPCWCRALAGGQQHCCQGALCIGCVQASGQTNARTGGAETAAHAPCPCAC